MDSWDGNTKVDEFHNIATQWGGADMIVPGVLGIQNTSSNHNVPFRPNNPVSSAQESLHKANFREVQKMPLPTLPIMQVSPVDLKGRPRLIKDGGSGISLIQFRKQNARKTAVYFYVK